MAMISHLSGFQPRAVLRYLAPQVLFCLALLVFAAPAKAVSFAPATNFAVDSAPQSVAIGNLNGDGFADLAVANANSNTVSVLLGNGAGSFEDATNFAVGSFPRSVAIGNLNGDGFADLAVASGDSNNVSVLLGNGAGSFGVATNFAVGLIPRSVAIGNLNGDGFADLAVASGDSNNVSVLLGNGAGSFVSGTNFAVDSDPQSVAIGNLNGDGFADLAVANANSNNVSVLLNTGATATAAPASLDFATQPLGTLSSPRTVTITNSDAGYPLEISRVRTSGLNRGDFIIVGDTCAGETVVPSGSCEVLVRFAPDAAGLRSASLEVRYNGSASPLSVPLSGTGGSLPVGPTGATGGTGPTGPTGPIGKPGKNAKVTCTVKRNSKTRVKVTCKVRYPSQSSSQVSWSLSRNGKVLSRGKTRARNGALALPRASKLRAGRYVLRLGGQVRATFLVNWKRSPRPT